MGYRNASVQNTTIIASPAAAAETIVATTGPINLITDSATVFLFWYASIQAGTGATALIPRIRRGTALTSIRVDAGTGQTVVAGSGYTLNACYFDNPAAGAEVQYSLSFQVTGGSTPSTVNDVCLMAIVL